ncbi:hypothetical protein CFC21_102637, partial [Triticum aestivum]
GRERGGGEAAVQEQLQGRGAVRQRGGHPLTPAPPQPRRALRLHLLLPRPPPRLRVRPQRHARRPPPPRQGRRRRHPHARVADPARHRRRDGRRAGLPPRAPSPAPRRQDDQHPPRRRVPRQGGRLRAVPAVPGRRRHAARVHGAAGHP